MTEKIDNIEKTDIKKSEVSVKDIKLHIRCMFGLHKYEVIDVCDVYQFDNVVGKNYVLQCRFCGKIKTEFVNSQLCVPSCKYQ